MPSVENMKSIENYKEGVGGREAQIPKQSQAQLVYMLICWLSMEKQELLKIPRKHPCQRLPGIPWNYSFKKAH